MSSKSLRARLARFPVCVIALIAAPLVTSSLSAWAEDAETAAPKLPADSIAYSDSARVVKISLPKAFKANTEFDDPGKLGAWIGPLLPGEEGNTAMCTLTVNVNFGRAKLAASSSTDQGELIPESVREGEGFYESCRKGTRPPFLWRRHIEKGGRLFTISFHSGHDDYAKVEPTVRAYLDSFEVTGEPREDKFPDEWKEKAKKDLVLWSHLEDKKAVDEMFATFVSTGSTLDKVLKGKPWSETPPKVRLFASNNAFESARDVDVGGTNENAVWCPKTESAYVNYLCRSLKGFEEETYGAVAEMRVSRYFGGAAPRWLQAALLRYAIYGMRDSAGKPEKATDGIIKMGQDAAQSAKRLDHWFAEANWSTATAKQGSEEVWAYLWFLLNGKAPKDARKALDNYVAALRNTGDVDAAAKVWDGVDFDGLLSSFKGWAEKWK